jgi:hypothetical protein
MGQRIGSILWDGVLFAGFIYLLLVMRSKVKPPQPTPFIQQASIGVKILIYAGVALFGYLFISDFL